MNKYFPLLAFFTILVIIIEIEVSNVIIYAQENEDVVDEINQSDNELLVTVSAAILGIIGTILGTKWVVNNWQKSKDLSELRKQILDNFTESLPRYTALMDSFVTKLAINYTNFNSNQSLNKDTLSETLPWSSSFYELSDYKTMFIKNEKLEVKNYNNERYSPKKIEEYFDNLKRDTEFYIKDFGSNDIPIKKYSKEFEELLNQFFNDKNLAMHYKGNITQYYKENDDLSNELNATWEYMMACFSLICKIMYSKNRKEFVENLKAYKNYVEFLADATLSFELILVERKLIINKNIKKNNDNKKNKKVNK